jgi:hypothetical protein
MTLGVFVAAVLVSLVFDRQERRHRFKVRLEYERLGCEMPAAKPRIPTLESILNIVVGLFFFSMGGILLYTFLVLGSAHGASGEQYIVAFCLAVGIAMIIVGGRALRENVLYRRRMKSSI